jgi:hypothetical protein
MWEHKNIEQFGSNLSFGDRPIDSIAVKDPYRALGDLAPDFITLIRLCIPNSVTQTFDFL